MKRGRLIEATPKISGWAAAGSDNEFKRRLRRKHAGARPVVIADGRVVKGRNRDRLLLVVVHCPGCRSSHVHYAKTDFGGGPRTAACGQAYWLHVIAAGIAA